MPGVAQLEGLSPPSLCFLREQVGPPTAVLPLPPARGPVPLGPVASFLKRGLEPHPARVLGD